MLGVLLAQAFITLDASSRLSCQSFRSVKISLIGYYDFGPILKNIYLEFFSEMELKGQTKDSGRHWALFSSLFPLELFPVSSPNALK